MFPNTDNKSCFKSVKDVLLDNNFDLESAQCIVDALEICLTCNNSKFNHQNSLQKDGTAQGLTCLIPMPILPWPNMTL